MELKLELAQRISRNERAAARKRRIDSLSINAHRNCVTGYCPYCTGNRTFSRNVPASVAIEEQLDTPVLPEPAPWTYYDTAATFYGKWDYADARNDEDFKVLGKWQAWEADEDAYLWSCLAEDCGIRWEPSRNGTFTHSQTVYDREDWEEWDD